VNILGINIGHDSGAAVLREGNVVAAINEERLSRKKMHHGFPYLAIDEALDMAGLTFDQLDVVSIEGLHIMPQQEVGFDKEDTDPKKKLLAMLGAERAVLGTETGLALARLLLRPSVIMTQRKVRGYFSERGFKGKFLHIDHHYCHAATAYLTQPMDEGVAVTLDASGEGYCSRVYRCSGNRMTLLHSITSYHSPAYYYAYVTQLLGFRPLRHEGKITGLAAFGNPAETAKVFAKHIRFDRKGLTFVNEGGYHFEAMKKLRRELEGYSREDISAGIQHWCEEIVCQYVQALIDRFFGGRPTNVFLAGGLFANVKVNQRIGEMGAVRSVYVFPNMGDGGVCLGAALAALERQGDLKEKIPLNHVYLGRDWTDTDILDALEMSGVRFRRVNDIANEVAGFLAAGKVVARFNGAMEYGPRALGNRSIIYPASDRNVNQWLNERLNRTEFMPFAPYVRDVDFTDYFRISEDATLPFRFMTMTCDVTDRGKAEAPATTHVDGTARPQVVIREHNPTYYDIVTRFKELTGTGVLVNTSFNMHEEPIVNTPEEAIKTFGLGGLDVLAIGSYIVEHVPDGTP